MQSPILGGDSVSRSKNLADNQLWNLYAELVDDKDGKSIGALYGVPGLDLLLTVGDGPIRAGGISTIAGQDSTFVYVVSGQKVFSFDTSYSLTEIGTLPNPITTPVSIINNGRQLVIFDGVGGYLIPGGYPLTGGAVGTPGTAYAADDDILLVSASGQTNATAQVTVLTVDGGGGILTFEVSISGAFNPGPTSFQQAETSGSGSGFVLTSPTYGPYQGIYTLTLPFEGPVSATYQDGFGLVNENGTQKLWQSTLSDLSIWPVLAFDSADASPDDVIALKDLHREVWVLKEDHTEIWVNAGVAGFSFQRLGGVFLEIGIVAPFSVATSGETLIWLSQNTHGQGIVVMTNGYQAIPISTQAMVNEIQTYTTLADAIGYVYQQGGHTFYFLTFPSANATWVYDVTTSALSSVPMWHRRASFSNGAQNRHVSNAFVNFNGRQIVGDFQNGNIYAFNLENYTDNGAPRKWMRTWRALTQSSMQPVRFASLEIDMETGITPPAGTDPYCQLRCSDDGGHTWPITVLSSIGKPGETSFRVKFNRLGATRRNSGLDRIFEVSSVANCRAAIIGAEVEV